MRQKKKSKKRTKGGKNAGCRGIYLERQIKSVGACRMHAINNAIGRNALTLDNFWNYCDKYDRKHKTQGSREFFMVNGPGDNLFTFILNNLRIRFAHDYNTTLTEELISKASSFICFDDKHAWAFRKVNERWYILDSLNTTAKTTDPLRYTKAKRIQYIEIYG